MAPYLNSQESAIDSIPYVDHVKAKVGVRDVKFEATAKPPVADDYMYDFKFNHPLPTSDVLGVEIPADCDAQKEAETIVNRLAEVLGAGDAQGFANLFLENGGYSPSLPLTRPFIFKYAKTNLASQVSGGTSSPSHGTTAPSTFNQPS